MAFVQAQKELQLRVEQNGEFLRKLMEEQQKAVPGHELPSFSVPELESELLPHSPSADISSPWQVAVRSDCYFVQPSNDKPSDTTEAERAKCHKRLRGQTSPIAPEGESDHSPN